MLERQQQHLQPPSAGALETKAFGFLDFIPPNASQSGSSGQTAENKLPTCSDITTSATTTPDTNASTVITTGHPIGKCTCHLSNQSKLPSPLPSTDRPPSVASASDDCAPLDNQNQAVLDDYFNAVDSVNLSQLPTDSSGIPIPQSLLQLVRLIQLELGDNGLMDHDKVDVPRLQAIMQNYKPSLREDWEQFAFFDPYRYTRNLIDDGNGKYNLLLLCWGQQQCSPIHDHANSHCVLKVMQGEITETRFAWPSADHANQPMQATTVLTLQEGQAAYMHDKIGLHRVSNMSADKPAVSLHLYSPPIKMCSTFCEESGQARKSGNCVFFSVRGQRNTLGSTAAGLSNS